VGPLVALLGDEEEKTRANAAGALGNLVRNSGALCGELVKVGALGRGGGRRPAALRPALIGLAASACPVVSLKPTEQTASS
jgi:hypothetical protein